MNHEKSIQMRTKHLAKGNDPKALLTFLAVVDQGRKDLSVHHKTALRAVASVKERVRKRLEILAVVIDHSMRVQKESVIELACSLARR